jgi:hypothetical protein
MKNYFFLLVLFFTSAAFAADSKLKFIDDNCNRAYKKVEALQQFFYKFDGNLPPIKDSKIKSIQFLLSQFRDFKSSTATRKKAFGELYNDPDYYQYLLQVRSTKLIKELEELNSKSSQEKDKSLIFSLPNVPSFGDYENPYLKLKKLVSIQNNVRDFFDELENVRVRLEQLGQQHRLKKSLEDDPQSLGAIIAFSKISVIGVIECNLEYLEAERISK